MNIQILNPTETLLYAADELKKYITLMSEGYIHPTVTIGSKKPDSKTITLATLGELSLDTSDLSNPFLEDIIDIDVTALEGYIAGSNDRSILMGIYKYLKSAGCRWVRPTRGILPYFARNFTRVPASSTVSLPVRSISSFM